MSQFLHARIVQRPGQAPEGLLAAGAAPSISPAGAEPSAMLCGAWKRTAKLVHQIIREAPAGASGIGWEDGPRRLLAEGRRERRGASEGLETGPESVLSEKQTSAKSSS